jgi:O-antigen ligase
VQSYDAPVFAGSLRSAVVAVWLVVLTNGPLFFLSRRVFGLRGAWEDPVVQPAIVFTAGAAVAFVVLDRFRLVGGRLAAVPRFPFTTAVLLGVWATMSAWWSLQPDVTLWRGIVYVALPFVAWVIADLSFDRFVDALVWAAGSLVVISLALLVLWPDAALDPNNDWRGPMTSRNSLAPICGLAVFGGLAWWKRGIRQAGGLLVLASVIGLWGSGSRTAVSAAAIALFVSLVLIVGRRRYLARPVWTSVALAVGAGGVGGLVAAAGLTAFWDEPTFAQRRAIWRLVGDTIGDEPFIGHGWEAFWYVPEPHTDELLRRGSAHGSIPELLLGLGVVGLLLWSLVVAMAIAGVVARAWRQPDTEAWLWLAVVTFLVVENLTESFVLWFSYNWVLLTAAALRFGSEVRHRSADGRPRAGIHFDSGGRGKLAGVTSATPDCRRR